MKTLIIHPQDPTTRFLCGIYDTIPNKTVIDSGIPKDQLRKKIDEHDRILMMGHGSPAGLFSVGQFDTEDQYIIDDSTVEILQDKITVFICCYADKFAQRYVEVIPSPSYHLAYEAFSLYVNECIRL